MSSVSFWKVALLVVAAAIAGAKSQVQEDSLEVFIRELGKVVAEEIRKVDPKVLSEVGKEVAIIAVEAGQQFVEDNPELVENVAEVGVEVSVGVSQGAQQIVAENPQMQRVFEQNPLLKVLGKRVVSAIANVDPAEARQAVENGADLVAANIVQLDALMPAGKMVVAEAVAVGSNVVADNADVIVEFIAQLVTRPDVQAIGTRVIKIVEENSSTIGPATKEILTTGISHIRRLMKKNADFAAFIQRIVQAGADAGSKLLKQKPELQAHVLGFLNQNPGILTAILEASVAAGEA